MKGLVMDLYVHRIVAGNLDDRPIYKPDLSVLKTLAHAKQVIQEATGMATSFVQVAQSSTCSASAKAWRLLKQGAEFRIWLTSTNRRSLHSLQFAWHLP